MSWFNYCISSNLSVTAKAFMHVNFRDVLIIRLAITSPTDMYISIVLVFGTTYSCLGSSL